MNYNYDESGILHVYFALVLLLLLIVPATLKRLKDWCFKTSRSSIPICNCIPCQDKRSWLKIKSSKSRWQLTSSLLLVGGWALVAFLLRHVLVHGKIEIAAFDPFEILGVKSSASDVQIKKAYRLMSLKFHPDKVKDVAPEVAQDRFVLISRAYKALTDPISKQNYELYGNPDGPSTQDIGIALPAWLVSSRSFWIVLGLYAGCFMLGLPWWIRRWWASSSRLTKDKILHITMALFYRDSKESFTIKRILELLSAGVEFKEEMPKRPSDAASISALHNSLKEAFGGEFESSKKYTANYCVKAHCLLFAHLYRFPLPDQAMREDQAFVVQKAHLLLNGMIQICIAKGWFNALKYCIMLGQMLIQAVPEHANQLLQLPWISYEQAASFKNRRTPVKSIKEFLTLAPADQRVLFDHMSDQEYEQCLAVARNLPIVEISTVKAFVQGYEDIVAGSIMTITVALKRVYLGQASSPAVVAASNAFSKDSSKQEGQDIGEEFEMDEDCCVKKRFLVTETGKGHVQPIHAPFFQGAEKFPAWWIILTDDDDDFVAPPQRITHVDSEKETSVVFQVPAPPRPTTLRFTATLKADYAMGLDCSKDFRIQVIAMGREESSRHQSDATDDSDDLSEDDDEFEL